jgi:copper(I)-binding protein
MTRWRRAALAAPALVLALTVAACGSSADPGPGAGSAAGDGTLTVTDPWAKAADSGMTAAFGTLVNDTATDITITSATSDASRMELHEMAMGDDGQMVMRPKEGGFVIPAHGTHELAPGADHVMFMDLTEPLQPGADIDVTLTADDGSSWTFTFPIRTFTGAEEKYQGSDGSMTTDPSDTMSPSEGSGDS